MRLWQPGASYFLSSRALALLRIGLGLAVMTNALEQLRYFSVLYSSRGLVTVELAREYLQGHFSPSIQLYLAGDSWQFAFILVFFLSGLLVAIGVGGKASALLCLYFIWSGNVRMPYHTGGDTYLAWAGFMVLCLPAFAAWAIQPSKARAPGRLEYFGYFAVVMSIYFFAGAWKIGAPWLQGDAVRRSLQYSFMATDLGRALSEYPALCRYLTPIVVSLEKWGPLLLLAPSTAVRTFVCVLFIGFHLVLGLCFHLQTLTLLTVSVWLGLLPEEAISFLLRKNGKWRGEGAGNHPVSGIRFAGLVAGALVLVVANAGYFGESALLRNASAWTRDKAAAWGASTDLFFFSPNPPPDVGWIRFVAKDGGGRERLYDPMEDRFLEATTATVPDDIFAETIHSRRWKAISASLVFDPRFPATFVEYLCRRLAGSGTEEVAIIFFHRPSATEPGSTPMARSVLGQGSCPVVSPPP